MKLDAADRQALATVAVGALLVVLGLLGGAVALGVAVRVFLAVSGVLGCG